MSRSLPEWIGKTDDERPPPRVRLRNFDLYKGVCQCGCGIKIRVGDSWDTDHKVALCNGGENRESNLVPLLAKHHKKKTANDVAEKSEIYERRLSHHRIRPKKKKMGYRLFDGTPVPPRYE